MQETKLLTFKYTFLDNRRMTKYEEEGQKAYEMNETRACEQVSIVKLWKKWMVAWWVEVLNLSSWVSGVSSLLRIENRETCSLKWDCFGVWQQIRTVLFGKSLLHYNGDSSITPNQINCQVLVQQVLGVEGGRRLTIYVIPWYVELKNSRPSKKCYVWGATVLKNCWSEGGQEFWNMHLPIVWFVSMKSFIRSVQFVFFVYEFEVLFSVDPLVEWIF